MTTPPKPKVLSTFDDIGAAYVAHDGVIYGRDSAYPEADPRHLWPSATCTPLHDDPVRAQASAEDIAFMLSNYTDALAVLSLIVQRGLTPEARRTAEILLNRDELYAARNAGGGEKQ